MTTNVKNRNDTSECKNFTDFIGEYKIKRNSDNTGVDEKGEYIVGKSKRDILERK